MPAKSRPVKDVMKDVMTTEAFALRAVACERDRFALGGNIAGGTGVGGRGLVEGKRVRYDAAAV